MLETGTHGNAADQRATASVVAASRDAGEILLARVDLTALFPEPAAAYVRARGGEIVTGRAVERIERQDLGELEVEVNGDQSGQGIDLFAVRDAVLVAGVDATTASLAVVSN